MQHARATAIGAVLLSLLPAATEAQDAARVQPQSYRVVLDNPQVRVLEFHARPGMGVCGIGMHSHPGHLTVLLGPQKVRIRLPDGTVRIQAGQLGDVFWEPPVTHEVENVSGSEARTLIVEVKPHAGTGR